MNIYLIIAVLLAVIAVAFFMFMDKKEKYTEMLPPVPMRPNTETRDALEWQLGGY